MAWTISTFKMSVSFWSQLFLGHCYKISTLNCQVLASIYLNECYEFYSQHWILEVDNMRFCRWLAGLVGIWSKSICYRTWLSNTTVKSFLWQILRLFFYWVIYWFHSPLLVKTAINERNNSKLYRRSCWRCELRQMPQRRVEVLSMLSLVLLDFQLRTCSR